MAVKRVQYYVKSLDHRGNNLWVAHYWDGSASTLANPPSKAQRTGKQIKDWTPKRGRNSMKNNPKPHHVTFCDRPVCSIGVGNAHEKGVDQCEFSSGYAAKKEAKRLNKRNQTNKFRAVPGPCPE